ncbi:MAG: hypothetical protein JXR69_10220 [Candidatus Delongbacteria bacterium]|nr:hypothetical protein [Candidatus Delongbacteria bacterium]
MQLFNPIMLGIFFLLVLFFILDLYHFIILNKKIKDKNVTSDLHIDKYHELKWRINTLLTVATVIGIILGYTGFDIQKKLTETFLDYDNKIAKLDSLIESSQKKLSSINSISLNLESKYSKLSEIPKKIENDIQNVKTDIKKVQDENLRRSQIYVVTSIPITIGKKDNEEQKIYYKDLNTNTNNKLPSFNKPPIIQILINEKETENISIIKNTVDYFIITYNYLSAITDENNIIGKEKPKTGTFDIWISNQ